MVASDRSRHDPSPPGTVRLCDTHDMVLVHRVFRREFGLLPAMIVKAPADDRVRAAAIGRHAQEMLDSLHHHHESEDELIWPKLRGHRGIDAATVDRMEAQHGEVAEILDTISPVLASWCQSGNVTTRTKLSGLFRRLHTAVVEHLDEEEQRILPIVETTLTPAQWAAVGARSRAAMSKGRLLVFLGHILEDASPSERTTFLGHVPLPGRLGYRLVGRKKHRSEVALLRRDLAP
jgi:hemerythrin-like domain-containing protein